MNLIEDIKEKKKNKQNELKTDIENTNLKNKFSWNYSKNVPVILNSLHIRDIIDIKIQALMLKQEKICKNIDEILQNYENSLEE